MSLSITPSDPSRVQRPAEPLVARERAAEATQTKSEPAAVPKADPSRMREELREAVDKLNEHMQKQSRNLAFSLDEKANRTVITVKNAQTGEVVRQIPDETMLKVAHSIEDFKGLLHNEMS